jgi:phosphohistidine phosphatase
MAVYLVQHGKACSKEQDPERPLSEEGRAQTKRIAEVAAGYGVVVARIQHSGKLRAKQTAEIMAAQLSPARGVEARGGIGSKDDAAAVHLDPASNTMLVGHLPFMERLVGHLVAGDAELRLFRFQQGGIVCLNRDEQGWFIKWTLMPEID